MSNPDSQTTESEASFEIDFHELYYLLREKAWLIITSVLLAGLLGGAYLMTAKKLFSARIVVQVEQSERKVVNIEQVNREDMGDRDALKTLEAALASRTLAWRVIQTLKLTTNQLGLDDRPARPYSEKEIVDQFMAHVSVALIRGTRLIAIEAEMEDPKLPPLVCDAVVAEYVKSNMEQRVKMNNDANKFLVDQAEDLKQKLEKSEQALQEYKEKNQSVSLDQSQNIVVDDLKVLNSNLSTAKAERLKLESDFAQVQKLGKKSPEDLLKIGTIASDPGLLEQKKKVSEQEAEIAKLSQRYLPKHPKYIQAQSQMQEFKDGLGRTAMHVAQSLGNTLEAAVQTEKKLDEALREQEKKMLDLNKMSISYGVLAREVDTDRTLYNSVLGRLKETDVTKGLKQEQFRIVETPVVPEKAIKPKKLSTLAASLFGGFVVSLGLVFGLNALDSSIKTVDRAEKLIGLSAVGAVPKGKSVSNGDALVILQEPHSAVAEAFRTLRTSLSLLGKGVDRRSFLFTSAVPGEGKSFCSINYAVSLAQQGLRTLLIDADLRLPTIGKRLFGDEEHAGTSDFIAGHVSLEDAIRPGQVENLSVLTAGNRAPNPAELLAAGGFGDLIKLALTKFDRVVVDSAPVNAVADTLLLVRHVQSVCLVVHAGKTPRKAVQRASQKLTEAGGRPVGQILNQLPAHGGVGYYYHYSAGEYGKGVYGAPVAKAKA